MPRIVILMSLTLAGCPLPTDDSGTTTATPTVPPEDFSACHAADGFDYAIVSGDTAASPVRIEGNTLSVDVGYGGGCETHLWAICWPDQSFMESDPVQAGLEIWHGGPPDMCDAYLFETLSFDLTPLHDAWQAAYGAGAGTIILNVAEAPESVSYGFDG